MEGIPGAAGEVRNAGQHEEGRRGEGLGLGFKI